MWIYNLPNPGRRGDASECGRDERMEMFFRFNGGMDRTKKGLPRANKRRITNRDAGLCGVLVSVFSSPAWIAWTPL